MKYTSPIYSKAQAMAQDVITASWSANNCTVKENQASAINPEQQVTTVSGYLSSLFRKTQE